MRRFLLVLFSVVMIPGMAATVSFAEPVRWEVSDGGNGHLYEAALVPVGITWSAANAAAQAMGNGWHLATITSAEENAFVFSLVSDNPAFWNCCLSGHSNGPWLGGYKIGPTKYDYAWVTGEPFVYTNWGPLEPFGNGDRISFFGYNELIQSYWNDVPDSYPGLPPLGYIVENDQPNGACCLPDGSCTEATGEDCNAAGGIYQGNGSDCASVTCQPPPPTDAEGWRRKGYDLGGTAYYPFSSVANSGQLGLVWQASDLNNAAVLTADLDNDGVLDIVASDGSSLVAYDGQGNVLWSVQTSAMLYYIGDLDEDSQPEVCVSYKDGANHLKMDVYNADGTFDKTLDRGPSGYDSYMVVLTHFGDYVVVGYGAGYSLSPRGVGILRYSSEGEDAYFATGGGGIWGTFALGDSDNDGLPEIALPWGTPHNGASANGSTDFDLYGVLVEADITASPAILSAQFIKPVSTLNPSTNPNGYDSAMMPDLDGNGASEILFLEGHNATYYPGSHYVYNVSSTGVLLSTWKGSSNGMFPLGTVINDLNGDGIKELVMSARDNETLSVVDGSTFATLIASPVVGRVLGATDFDGDGQDEVIVHQSGSGNVEVLDVDGATLSPIGI